MCSDGGLVFFGGLSVCPRTALAVPAGLLPRGKVGFGTRGMQVGKADEVKPALCAAVVSGFSCAALNAPGHAAGLRMNALLNTRRNLGGTSAGRDACTPNVRRYTLRTPHISRLSAMSFAVLFRPPPAAVAITTACLCAISGRGR